MAEHIKTISPENSISKNIINTALNSGFDDCGICKAEFLEEDKKYYLNWLKQNFHADMSFLENYLETRFNPELLFPEAKSVVVVLKNYYTQSGLNDKNLFISKYALGKDYHAIIKSQLKNVLNSIRNTYPEINGRVYVDTAPVFERSNAVKAGLGFTGNNKCLINPRLGSFVFIGELVLDTELDYNKAYTDSCKDCKLCIKACPTGALSKKGLDANKCISYHTIENRNKIPQKIQIKITNQIFGCDICQNVCPYNSNLKEHNEPDFMINKEIQEISLEKLENITDTDFENKLKDTVLLRAGRKKLIDNIKIVMKNVSVK